MATSDSLIQVRNLKKHYHRGAIKALDGVTADINKGDVMVVIGPSGSGKSTFLRRLNLLEEPTDGEIIFNGVDITKKKYKDASGKTVKLDIDGLRQKMGMVFQHFNLYNNKTVLQNVMMAPAYLRCKDIDKAKKKNRMIKFKNMFRKKKKPRALSNSGNQNAKKQTESSRSHEKTSKSEQQNDAAELQMSEPQEDTVEDINEISEKVIMEPISISEEISEDEKKLRTKIADLISNIVGKIKMTVGKLFRIVQNFLGIPKRILKKMQSLALTIRNFCDKINWGKEFLDHPRTKEALSFLWKNAKKLIYHVLPTRITGKITFGNEDPAVTGMVLAVLGMTIPFHKNKIEAAPLFDDENVLEGEILLKGRIYGIVVLKTAAELYFNKNIKYVIHRWRHKEVKHGERE